ncbi:MAG TPA: dethiobiotin synthase [Chlamydiales bacterium]|nr:dethiobiotin synthase [Chlamydiales bacterium]
MKKNRLPQQIFLTGTDTDVGKTFIAALLCQGLKAHYFKPIQSGNPHDKTWIQSITNLPSSFFHPETYLLKTPLSPHAAAEIDNIEIEMDQIHLPKIGTNPLIVEGCGGVLVPLNKKKDLVIDLMKKFNLPTIIVTRSSLGTINHTLLTIEALKNRQIPIHGIIMNGPVNLSNKKAIETHGNIPVIAQIPHLNKITPETFKTLFKEHFV